MFKSFYTKEQLTMLLLDWKQPVVIPKGNQSIVLEFPPDRGYRRCRYNRATQKSTYGKPLYEVTLYNP